MRVRVKRIPVRTVIALFLAAIALFLAAALGLGAGWLVFGRGTHRPVQRADYIGHIVEWVNGGGQPNTSWLVESNGERYWIPNTSIYHCLVKAGHTDLRRQPPTVLDDLPDLGKWASCG